MSQTRSPTQGPFVGISKERVGQMRRLSDQTRVFLAPWGFSRSRNYNRLSGPMIQKTFMRASRDAHYAQKKRRIAAAFSEVCGKGKCQSTSVTVTRTYNT